MLPPWIRHLAIKVARALHYTSLISDRKGMNPFDLWYEQNSKMREFINKYYEAHIDAMDSYPKTKEQMKRVFRYGRTMDKLLVLTVLAAYAVYIDNC